VLRDVLPEVLQQVQPDLVLYNAGVDVHQDDALGKLALTDEGISHRDRAVFSACLQHGVPIACAIGGGYEKNHNNIVRRHMHLHRAAAEHMPGFAALMDARRQRKSAAAAAAAAMAAAAAQQTQSLFYDQEAAAM
jgi:acetoin utilization deacetylase AcuC-like enzyme